MLDKQNVYHLQKRKEYRRIYEDRLHVSHVQCVIKEVSVVSAALLFVFSKFTQVLPPCPNTSCDDDTCGVLWQMTVPLSAFQTGTVTQVKPRLVFDLNGSACAFVK